MCRACATAVLFSCGEWDRAVGVCEDVLASAGPAHARAVSTGILGLVHALRGAARLARPLLLESNLAATRIELTAMELLSSWGLCILDDAAGGHDAAVDRAQADAQPARADARAALQPGHPAVAGHLLRRAQPRRRRPGTAPRSCPISRRPPASRRPWPRWPTRAARRCWRMSRKLPRGN